VTFTILERLHVLSERYVRKHLEPLGRNERANEEHRDMLQAWLARDERKIAALTVVHIGKTLDDLRLQLQTDSKGPPG
jgi:DNA-binding GntR family transcriptional regulator